MDGVDWGCLGVVGATDFLELGPEVGWAAGSCHYSEEGLSLLCFPAPAWTLCQGLGRECGIWCLRAWF